MNSYTMVLMNWFWIFMIPSGIIAENYDNYFLEVYRIYQLQKSEAPINGNIAVTSWFCPT